MNFVKLNSKIDLKNAYILVAVAVLIGWIAGNLYAGSVETGISDESDQTMSADVHAHETFEIENTDTAPTVKLRVDSDAKAGWNLSLIVDNFKFTPENVNQTDVLNEGHAHLWVDGIKVARLYSPYYYLSGLDEGDHEITVTLNSNTHKDYLIDGDQISDRVTVTETGSGTSNLENHDHQ